MILLHRLTPYAIACVALAGFWFPWQWKHGIWEISPSLFFVPFAIVLLVVLLLLMRMNRWQVKQREMWNFVSLPMIFLFASYLFLLFFENETAQYALAGISTVFLFFYSEYLFYFLHLPSRYQPYSLEHLSLVISVLSVFFLSGSGIALRIFLQAPLYFLLPPLFLFSWYVVFITVLFAKAEESRAKQYALGGALLIVELFATLLFLPSGFYSGAALIAVFLYAFLGLTRKHMLKKLSKGALARYLVISGISWIIILSTAQWF